MKKWMLFCILALRLPADAQTNNDAERLRISVERSAAEASFTSDEVACYKKFWVNSCLDGVKVRRRDVLADLRRQEISINDQERKARGAEQVQKAEDKVSAEKQQQEADSRAQALKDFEDRMARDKLKNADRLKAQANEKANLDAAAARTQSEKDKDAGRSAKQDAAAEEVRKYNDKLEKAKDRAARLAREKASKSKASANPLPIPN